MRKMTIVFFLFLIILTIEAYTRTMIVYAKSVQSTAGIRFVPNPSNASSKELAKEKDRQTKRMMQRKLPKTIDQQSSSLMISGGLIVTAAGDFFLLRKGKNEKSSFNNCTV